MHWLQWKTSDRRPVSQNQGIGQLYPRCRTIETRSRSSTDDGTSCLSEGDGKVQPSQQKRTTFLALVKKCQAHAFYESSGKVIENGRQISQLATEIKRDYTIGLM
jgi:hypothetical protein